jgi:hypothetical protein
MKTALIAMVTGLTLLSTASFAQEASSKKSYGWAGLQFTSDAAYLGRKDSVAIPYVTPQIGYVHSSGWNITGSLSYLPRSGDNRIDVFTLGTGYDFSIGDKFYAGAEYNHNFFSNQSYSVLAGVANSISAYGGYSLSFIDVGVGADMNFGSETDFLVNGNIGHEFTGCNDKLHIDPSFTVNAGQYNTYITYYTQKRYNTTRTSKSSNGRSNNGNGNGRGNSSGSTTTTTTTTTTTINIEPVQGFHVLDYELKMPVRYETDRFKFVFTPVYMMPVNPAVIDINGVMKTETLHPVFTAQIMAAVKFSKARASKHKGDKG